MAIHTSSDIIAQRYVISSSVSHYTSSAASGSHIFGDSPDDIQQFTGSLRVTGSGNHYIQTGNVGIGTTAPGGLLHLYEGASGATAPASAQLVLEDDGGNNVTIGPLKLNSWFAINANPPALSRVTVVSPTQSPARIGSVIRVSIITKRHLSKYLNNFSRIPRTHTSYTYCYFTVTLLLHCYFALLFHCYFALLNNL